MRFRPSYLLAIALVLVGVGVVPTPSSQVDARPRPVDRSNGVAGHGPPSIDPTQAGSAE